jgi:SAM-dependent methyltransferase
MEGYGKSTYGDLIADLYDELYAEMDPGAAVELLAGLAGSGRALELGIGTGRVALPLSARGVHVEGIDSSEAMVAHLRGKPGGHAIKVHFGNYADVKVEGEFSLVYVPFTTLFALEFQEEQLRCLSNVSAHLGAGGHFVMDAFVPDPARFRDHQSSTVRTITSDSMLLDVALHDPVAQRVDSSHVVVRDGTVRLVPVRVRYCWPSELDLMARLAGLRLESRFADYAGSAFGRDSMRHVSVYVKEPERRAAEPRGAE